MINENSKPNNPVTSQVNQMMLDSVVKLLEDSGAVESGIANYQLARRICCSVLLHAESEKS